MAYRTEDYYLIDDVELRDGFDFDAWGEVQEEVNKEQQLLIIIKKLIFPFESLGLSYQNQSCKEYLQLTYILWLYKGAYLIEQP